MDAATNTAILSIGLSGNPAGTRPGGVGAYQVLDLSTNTFGPPIPVGATAYEGTDVSPTSENMAFDPVRHLVLSPDYFWNYQVVQLGGASPLVFDNLFPNQNAISNSEFYFDSAAVDCTTGIALAASENVFQGALTLVDLTQAAFTPGSPKGTWTAPFSVQSMGLPVRDGSDEMTGIAVAPGTHLGLNTAEFGDATFAVFQLPSSAGTGTPALVDWADGMGSWGSSRDPHPLTAYVSPSTGRAMGLVTDISLQVAALIDLQGVLDAPRLSGTHHIDPTYDLVAHGIVSLIGVACNGISTATDINNCGTCGHVCPTEANSSPTCAEGVCRPLCFAGYSDCDHNYANGCEANVLVDPTNCGGCSIGCAEPNAAGVCTGGVCSFVCNAGFTDCDGFAGNGCEFNGPCNLGSGFTPSLSGPTNVAVGATASYTAGVGFSSGPLSYAWTLLSGPAAVVFSSPGALTTTTVFPAAGTYVVQFEVSNGYSNIATSLTVTATYVNRPPVVTVGANQTITAPNLTATVVGNVTDDGLPAGGTLTGTWSLVSGPAAVTIETPTTTSPEPGPLTASSPIVFSYPGTYVFQLDVSDGRIDSLANTTITVNPPAATTAGTRPTVAIGGMTDDEEVTKPTPVLATVSDGSWVLESRLGGRDDVNTAFGVLASGTGAVNGTTIANFDPTLLLNGIYTLRLSAMNSAGSASTSVSLSVTQRMKLGNFTLTFTDLDTVVSNLALSVTRTYDSREKATGDFGYGWNLGIRDVRIEKSGKTGAYWLQQFNDDGVLGQYCLLPTKASSVAITFPNGRQYRLVPQSSPQCQPAFPFTQPTIVWVSTSDPDNPTIQLATAGPASVVGAGGGGAVELQDGAFDIWDPRDFTLTIEDGSLWQIGQDIGVTSVRDRKGNTITVTPEGILSSSGKQVTFARDSTSRITAITDPNGKSMMYSYDSNGDLATFTDRAGKVTQFTYAKNHYLTEIQDPLGRQPVKNVYDDNGRLVSTTDAAGNTVHYTPNLAANQDQITDRLGHTTLYTYNDRGDITQKVDATGALWNYTYDLRGNQLTATDPLGKTKKNTYDGADNLLTSTDELGNTTTNTYDGFRDLLTTTDPLAHLTSNTYDGSGNLVTRTDALGNTTRYAYDPEGNMLSATDALANVTTYQYDPSGHVTQKIDALGHGTTFTYDANGNKKTQDEQREVRGGFGVLQTNYTYDAVGRLTQSQQVFSGSITNGPTRSTTYTATGKRQTDTDPLGRVTKYTYDALDRIVATTRPDGTTTSQTYDAENHRASSTDAAGNTTAYEYDPLGRLTRTTFADGSSTSTAYDRAGHAIEAIDELGHVRWSVYDAAGRLTSTSDPLENATRYVYDAAGNRTSVTDALGHTTSYAYDADKRLVATTYPDNTTDSKRYDALGRLVAKTDALNHSTEYAYDGLGELVRVSHDLGNVTTYGYDSAGNKVTQSDANRNVTRFDYDPFTNALTFRTLPDNSVESFTDDLAGQITQHTDFLGRTTTFANDLMGRVRSRTYPDSTVVSFTYTPTGQRQTETDARGTTTFGYDVRNRPVMLTYPDGRQLAYGYDSHGDRTSLTAKVGSRSLTTTTSYDLDERSSTVTDPVGRAFSFMYDAAGNRQSVQYPNGTTTTYAYDVNNRVTNIMTANGTETIASNAYVLDLAGRRTSVTEADGTVRQYRYDSVDRLTSETVSGTLSYAKTFTYDGVGNRLSQTTTGAGAASVSYTYDSRDRLTGENATAYAYDANGNVTSKPGEAAYGWDFDNRLTSATMSSGTAVTHQYDAEGNRVQTSVTPSGGRSAFSNLLVDTAGCPSCRGGGALSQVVAETDGSGNIAAVYVRDQDELLEVMRPGASPGTWTTSFVHHDALGSVRVLTDETGTTIDTRAYEAFGTKNVEAGSDPLTYSFAGEPFEPTSMLAYHRARWMDARVGRFAGMDPAGGQDDAPITWHRYIYAADDPANKIDPSGRTAIQGIIIHQYIGADFVAQSTGTVRDVNSPVFGDDCRLSNSTINTILGVFGIPSRPDLIDRCTHEIWEIKQWDDKYDAERDLIYYLTILDNEGETDYRPGDSYTPPAYIPLPGNNTATSWMDASGIILYRISSSNFRRSSLFYVPAVGDIVEGIVDVGIGGI
jgi:RHS repeat-associated protein